MNAPLIKRTPRPRAGAAPVPKAIAAPQANGVPAVPAAKAIAAPSSRALAPARAPSVEGYVATAASDGEPADPLAPEFLREVAAVRVVSVTEPAVVCAPGKTLAAARGYQREDLFAIAEIAHTYLFSGFPQLALVLFEGLHAVAENEPYFALALGLSHDLCGDLEHAETWYRTAGALDPSDARPDVNRAEILIEQGDLKEARRLLERGRAKLARKDHDAVLEKKTEALRTQLSKLESRRG